MITRIVPSRICSFHKNSIYICFNEFSSSQSRLGRKSRVPFDKRFPVLGRHLSRRVKGGDRELSQRLSVHDVQIPGYRDKLTKVFKVVPEMVPEFIVPDLTDFELKPYVSYKVPEVTQSEFTARNLFDACYAEKLAECYRAGKLTKEEMNRILDLKPKS